jgi:single-stranded DNA-binding protein
VYVEGQLAIRNCTDRENRKHAYREIVASEVRFLDAAPKREARNSGEFITESSAELQ